MEFPISDGVLTGFYKDFEDAYYSPRKHPQKFSNYELVKAWFLAQAIFVQAQKEGKSYAAAEAKVDGMIKKLPKKPREERLRLPKEEKISKKKK